VRSTFKYDNKGTLILGVKDMEINNPVAGVAADLSQIRVVVCDIPDTPGEAATLFGALAKENISVDMIIQSYARKVKNDIAFTINKEDLQKTQEILSKVKEQLGAGDVSFDDNIAKVSIIGAGMIDRPGIASTMFKTLADSNINIRMISTSEIKISCLINKEDAQKALKALHEVFNLGCDEIAEVKGTLPDV
jgi:aspartate kinase